MTSEFDSSVVKKEEIVKQKASNLVEKTMEMKNLMGNDDIFDLGRHEYGDFGFNNNNMSSESFDPSYFIPSQVIPNHFG